MKYPTPILVSACLLGVNCRYDGTHNFSQSVLDYLELNQLLPIPVCPEQLAGLSTPRPKVWFKQGDGQSYLQGNAELIDENGLDAGSAFMRGAEEVLRIAGICHCERAILKQRSPSCGSRQIHRDGMLVDGVGLTCALLQQAGLKVTCEESLN